MAWVYEQSTGILEHNGEEVGVGYSGNGSGLNNPKLQMVHNHGPIPQGFWEIGIFFDDLYLGPCVAALKPQAPETIFGRGGFFIHGDNQALNHSASDGCIILSKTFREAIRDSNDNQLQVIE